MVEINFPCPGDYFEAFMPYVYSESWNFDKEPRLVYSEEEKMEIRKDDRRLYELFLRTGGKIPPEAFAKMKTYLEENLDKDIEERVAELRDPDIRKYRESQISLKAVRYIGSTYDEFTKNLRNHVEYCIVCLKNYLNYLIGLEETEAMAFSVLNPRKKVNLREKILYLDTIHLALFTTPEAD